MRTWTEIIKDLHEPLNISRVKTRQQGSINLPYLKGDDVINTANRIFEEDGWDVVPLGKVERFEVGTKQTDSGQVIVYVYTVPFMVRLHGLLEDGTIHTIEKGDVGKNSTQSEFFQQHEMAISGCATDALKRAMRHLGRQFGITLYDKDSEDFKAATGKKGTTTTTKKKKTTTTKKKTTAKKKTASKEKQSKIQKALAYVIPDQVTAEGKVVRLPNAGMTIEQVLDDPMAESLLTYLAGLRDSPAGTAPFVAQTAEESKLQSAISYVLLNKLRDSLEEEELDVLKARLKG